MPASAAVQQNLDNCIGKSGKIKHLADAHILDSSRAIDFGVKVLGFLFQEPRPSSVLPKLNALGVSVRGV